MTADGCRSLSARGPAAAEGCGSALRQGKPWAGTVTGRPLRLRRAIHGAASRLVAASALVLTSFGQAQSLEPRAYSPSPVGANFALVSFAESSGTVLLDSEAPFDNVTAKLDASALGYGHTFSLLGRQALISVAVPYIRGTLQGQVGESSTSIQRSGMGNLQTRFSVNLLGSPALSPQAFAQEPARFILGTSLTVVAPTGQYDPTRLINIGTNRWAYKAELGISEPLRNLVLDCYAGVWWFTDNRSYYPGQSTRSQDPLATLQAHLSYTFRPRLWLAVDTTWYGGGGSSVNHVPANDRQDNSRAGATLSLPLGRAQSLKSFFSTGVSARSGQDFTTWGVGYQVVWF